MIESPADRPAPRHAAPAPPAPGSPRVLLIRLSAVGDVLHALPVAAAIRREIPGARIGWLVEDRNARLLHDHPMIDALHVVPRKAIRAGLLAALRGPVRSLRRELRDARYDVAIDLQGLTKSAVWAWLSGARRRIGFGGEDAREISRIFYTERVVAGAPHVVEKNLALLAALGVLAGEPEFPVHVPAEARARASAIWGDDEATARPLRVVLNPGAGWATKRWPPANYGLLAARMSRELGARVALAWGPGEEALALEALASAGSASLDAPDRPPPDPFPAGPGVARLPPTTLPELLGAIAGADLFVAGDTGPSQFAAALGVPTLSLFGASDARRNEPRGPRARSIRVDSLPCSPCWNTRCSWREPLACMTGLNVDRVFDEAVALLDEERRGAPAR